MVALFADMLTMCNFALPQAQKSHLLIGWICQMLIRLKLLLHPQKRLNIIHKQHLLYVVLVECQFRLIVIPQVFRKNINWTIGLVCSRREECSIVYDVMCIVHDVMFVITDSSRIVAI